MLWLLESLHRQNYQRVHKSIEVGLLTGKGGNRHRSLMSAPVAVSAVLVGSGLIAGLIWVAMTPPGYFSPQHTPLEPKGSNKAHCPMSGRSPSQLTKYLQRPDKW